MGPKGDEESGRDRPDVAEATARGLDPRSGIGGGDGTRGERHQSHLSRRDVLEGAGLAAFGTFLGLNSPALAGSMPMRTAPLMTTAAQMPGRIFFTDAEAAFIAAAVARLIPSDGIGPGAIEAGVPNFLDKQLGGDWGRGERLYLNGPYNPHAPPELGYQLSFAPAEMFRRSIGGIVAYLQARGQVFSDLDPAAQDAFLGEMLEKGGAGDLDGVPSEVFFSELWTSTLHGYFSDPAYGGNRDMVAWAAIGFPGAYAAYYNTVELHGEAFAMGPVSILDHGVLSPSDMDSMEQQR